MLADSFVERLTDEQTLAREEAAISLCRERYLADGVDLTTYDSATIVDDMVEVMTALGYDEWNLIGGSYGTRLALTAMRDAPQHIRSAVLDAPAPPVVDVDLERARLFEGKLEKLWAACQADAACGRAYPDIDATFWDLVANANADPIEVDTTTPDGVVVPIEIDGYGIMEGTFQAMWDTSLLGLIPFAIDDIARGNTGVLSQIASQLLFVDFGIATGMFWSVQCNEEWPFYTAAALSEATDGVRAEILAAQIGGPTTVAGIEENMKFCEAWNDPNPDPVESRAVSSAIPTLILAGEFDPNTPTEFGEVAASTLSNSYLIEVPSSGHFVTYPQQQCTNPLIAAFIDAPQQRPDDSCIRAIAPVDFVVAEEEASPTPAPTAAPRSGVGVITAPDTGTGPHRATVNHGLLVVASLAITGIAATAAGWRQRRR